MTKKKSSASSRPGKLISVSAESIFSRPVSKTQRAVLSGIAKRQAAGDDSGIDYSDIPPLSSEQLAQFRRSPKVLVAARLDKEVYDWLRQYGKGYSTRINGILRTVMERAGSLDSPPRPIFVFPASVRVGQIGRREFYPGD